MDGLTLRIGFSGHQQIGDESTIAFVAQSLRELLTMYQQQARESGRTVVVYSSLAMGADQLFVQLALDLNIPVEAIIPCAQYNNIFPSDAELSGYKRLLHACHSIHDLPSHDCSDDAYLAASRWIVHHCDLMLLVWNGLPPKGRGGTGDTASYARLVKRPLVHINTRRQTIKMYGDISTHATATTSIAPKQDFTVAKHTVYQGL